MHVGLTWSRKTLYSLGCSPLRTRARVPTRMETAQLLCLKLETMAGHLLNVREDHALFIGPWCNDGEGQAVNVNLYGDSQSQVRWHSDDEPLFEVSQISNLIISPSLVASAFFSMETSSVLFALCGGRLVAFEW